MKKTEEGSFIILAAMLLLSLTGIAVFSFDIITVYASQTMMQNAAQAAAMSALKAFSENVQAGMKPDAAVKNAKGIAVFTAKKYKISRYSLRIPEEKILLGRLSPFPRVNFFTYSPQMLHKPNYTNAAMVDIELDSLYHLFFESLLKAMKIDVAPFRLRARGIAAHPMVHLGILLDMSASMDDLSYLPASQCPNPLQPDREFRHVAAKNHVGCIGGPPQPLMDINYAFMFGLFAENKLLDDNNQSWMEVIAFEKYAYPIDYKDPNPHPAFNRPYPYFFRDYFMEHMGPGGQRKTYGSYVENNRQNPTWNEMFDFFGPNYTVPGGRRGYAVSDDTNIGEAIKHMVGALKNARNKKLSDDVILLLADGPPNCGPDLVCGDKREGAQWALQNALIADQEGIEIDTIYFDKEGLCATSPEGYQILKNIADATRGRSFCANFAIGGKGLPNCLNNFLEKYSPARRHIMLVSLGEREDPISENGHGGRTYM